MNSDNVQQPASRTSDAARPLPAIVSAHLVEAKEEQTSPQSEMMRRYGATDKEPCSAGGGAGLHYRGSDR